MFALEVVEQAASTNDELKRRAEAGAGEVALMARRQTAGRGRMGRLWTAPAGNLNLSVLLRPGPVRSPGHWSLMCGVALAEAVRAARPDADVRLKWPNDVLLDGGKLAGILLEAGGDWVVAGFGVNLVAAPVLDRPTACLGVPLGPEAFAEALLGRVAAWRDRMAAEGFRPVRDAWLASGPAPGAALPEGTFAGLADDGALLVTRDGTMLAVR